MNKKKLIISGLLEVKKKIEKRNQWRSKMLYTKDLPADFYENTKRVYQQQNKKINYLDNLIKNYQSMKIDELEDDIFSEDEEFNQLNFK